MSDDTLSEFRKLAGLESSRPGFPQKEPVVEPAPELLKEVSSSAKHLESEIREALEEKIWDLADEASAWGDDVADVAFSLYTRLDDFVQKNESLLTKETKISGERMTKLAKQAYAALADLQVEADDLIERLTPAAQILNGR